MHRKGLDRLVRLAVAFDKAPKPAADVEIVVPEDLSTLTDDELSTLRTSVLDGFAAIYGDGAGPFTAADLETMKGLKDAKTSISAEITVRETASAESAAAAAALAADMQDDEPEVEAADEVVAEAEQIVEEAVLEGTVVAASAGPMHLKVPTGRRKAAVVPVNTDKPAMPFRLAAGGNGGISSITHHNEAVDYDTLADTFSGAASQKRSRPTMRSRTALAVIKKDFPEDFKLSGRESTKRVSEVIRAVTDQSRMVAKKYDGNSLVAAGGWCAPSETLYDLCMLESRDGMLQIPEVQVNRGGIRNTLGPDWAEILASTGFCFTEAEDITGTYSLTNEVQSLTEGGAGLTSYTITYAGQTTGAIDDDATAATVQTALEALSNLAPGDVVVTGTTNPIEMVVTFGGTLAGTNVASFTTTPTGGTGVVNVAVVTQGGAPGPKPCNTVECPEFTDHRLDVCGVCIQAGILGDRAYPEATRRYVEGAVTAHMHRVDANIIADIVAGSTAVTVVDGNANPGTAAPLLAAIELQVEGIKYANRMGRNSQIEAVFPYWIRGMIRADLARRSGVDLLGVSDAMIDQWFRMRGVSPQFVYNWQVMASNPTAWPASVQFLLYPAGTWVRLSSELITLELLHDSALNSENNFTAIFTEEGYSTMRTCHISRVVTVTVCESGAAGSSTIVCP